MMNVSLGGPLPSLGFGNTDNQIQNIIAESSDPFRKFGIPSPEELRRLPNLLSGPQLESESEASKAIKRPFLLMMQADTNKDGKIEKREVLRWLADPPVGLSLATASQIPLGPGIGVGDVPTGSPEDVALMERLLQGFMNGDPAFDLDGDGRMTYSNENLQSLGSGSQIFPQTFIGQSVGVGQASTLGQPGLIGQPPLLDYDEIANNEFKRFLNPPRASASARSAPAEPGERSGSALLELMVGLFTNMLLGQVR